jgi:hypothetical protein
VGGVGQACLVCVVHRLATQISKSGTACRGLLGLLGRAGCLGLQSVRRCVVEVDVGLGSGIKRGELAGVWRGDK